MHIEILEYNIQSITYLYITVNFIGPVSRAENYLAERVDVLTNKVRASIRNHQRRYYGNNVRRVDYDYNDYVYADEYYDYYHK